MNQHQINLQDTVLLDMVQKNKSISDVAVADLKSDYRLGRNFYKSVVEDTANILLAAAAYNFKRTMKALRDIIQKICEILRMNNISQKWAFKGTTNYL